MARIRCRQCSHEQAPAFFCTQCGAVMSLPSNTDYLDVMGLPPVPALDVEALREKWLELSRRLHPDRFPDAAPEDLRASVQGSALLNSAWNTLRDPESRGRWWLARGGEGLGKDNNQVPPAIAALVFEVQETLDGFAPGDDAARAEISRIQEDLEARRTAGLEELEADFASWPEATDGPENAKRLSALKARLSELSYLATLLRDVGRALDGN